MIRSSFVSAFACVASLALAQNPIIHHQYCADPTARVFDGTMYLYPSHDIDSPVERLNDWFCMADYHVFSSPDLVDWTDHGVIVSQESVPWVAPDSYAMWAPDCVYKDGVYYFYFPAAPKGVERGFAIGVATAQFPEGPFTPMDAPIEGIFGIDPCVLVDDDGQSYIYWSGMGIRGAKLADDMCSLASEAKVMEGLPEGFKEGPFAFKRGDKYYLTFPWVRDVTETLAYAMSDSPLGPWEFKGLIMEESPTGCWTNHHSLVEFNDQWYLFYHHNDYSPDMDKRRSARIDKVEFNPDGTIQLVQPTLRGVGQADAYKPIHIDRYSEIGDGAHIAFIDTLDRWDGWKTVFAKKDAFVRFDNVNFGTKAPKSVRARVRSLNGGKLTVKTCALGDTAVVAADISIPPSQEWIMVEDMTVACVEGIVDITVACLSGDAEVDYICFSHNPYAQSAGVDDGMYFFVPDGDCSAPDADGFIRRWMLLDPIDKPNRTNTVFTDSYLRDAFYHEYFKDQFSLLPRQGQTVKVGANKLQWHDLESTGYNVHLYRFASTHRKQVYGVLFWAVTVIDCPEEFKDVRLSVGSNSASMWWLDGEEVLLLSGDRRMVIDDCASRRLTLHKGRNVLRGAVINGPGMSAFCVRFIGPDGNPITDFSVCK